MSDAENCLTASPLALGCMGMSEFYSDRDADNCAATIRAAVDSGIKLFDTADMYGPFTNEELLGQCLAPYRRHVMIATKFGYVRAANGARIGLNGRPEYVKQCCDASLRRLRTDVIDLYYLHRIDPNVPIEDTVGAMRELVENGKVRYLGLSEVAPHTIRRAQAVARIAALQTEYSLLAREPERDLFPLLAELGITFVAYAPLARGLLTGRYATSESLAQNDYRRGTPRFQGDNFYHNVSLLESLRQVAARHGATLAQVAISWVRQQLTNGVALVGTTRTAHLMENLAAGQLVMSKEEITDLSAAFPVGAARGDRYADMSRVNS
jgi:aryl-alcohol dehydrogenase-like predicted oxidoreductase